jgi:hypothetical protein
MSFFAFTYTTFGGQPSFNRYSNFIAHNGLCKWSAGLKVQNFQNRTEPIRLFNISCFPSIVKDELAVLQQRAAAPKTAEARITYDTLL